VAVEYETRIAKLEWRTKEHEEDIREVRATAMKLAESLEQINKCLHQIKFTAFGAIAMLMLKESGLGATVAMMFP
jgi:uncharacterized coiled-coil protein SlyX